MMNLLLKAELLSYKNWLNRLPTSSLNSTSGGYLVSNTMKVCWLQRLHPLSFLEIKRPPTHPQFDTFDTASQTDCWRRLRFTHSFVTLIRRLTPLMHYSPVNNSEQSTPQNVCTQREVASRQEKKCSWCTFAELFRLNNFGQASVSLVGLPRMNQFRWRSAEKWN